MSRRRVAVTGIGLMSALGSTRDEVWRGLLEGRCGIGDVSLFDASGYRSSKAAEMRPYPRDPKLSPHAWERLSRADQTAIIASREALADSGLLDSGVDLTRAGVMLGSGTADLKRNEEWFDEAQRVGLRRAPPAKIFNHFPSTPSDTLASYFGFEGAKAWCCPRARRAPSRLATRPMRSPGGVSTPRWRAPATCCAG